MKARVELVTKDGAGAAYLKLRIKRNKICSDFVPG
jgi:hypothetical protein